MMYLETDRLILRGTQVPDIPALVAIWTDPDVTKFMGGPRDGSFLQQAFEDEVYQTPLAPFDLYPVLVRNSGQVVGHCGFLEKEIDGQHEIEIIYVMARAAWGKGYATEITLGLQAYAREVYGLQRLVALIDPDNKASEAVALKTGMTLEKTVLRPGGHLKKLYVVIWQ